MQVHRRISSIIPLEVLASETYAQSINDPYGVKEVGIAIRFLPYFDFSYDFELCFGQ